ncbi:hypothetical protein J14TS2_29800 [Bacillus sp. J14TS2]|nr:hypothetical protein J14TS2_29800 [Bacillus sp. J14TS2]
MLAHTQGGSFTQLILYVIGNVTLTSTKIIVNSFSNYLDINKKLQSVGGFSSSLIEENLRLC